MADGGATSGSPSGGVGGDEARPNFEFDYAWNWFQYHAAQRLTAFNFFLIIVGLLLVAYAQAIDHGWVGVGVAVGALGALVAVGFSALDVRNEELVNCGRQALLLLEKESRLRLATESAARGQLQETLGDRWVGGLLHSWVKVKPTSRAGLFTHRLWLRLILAAVGIGFFTGAVWALLGYPGT